MDGRQSQRNTERPIAKPNSPLPLVFSPSKRSEWSTKRQKDPVAAERAHFYVKHFDDDGRPTYGFFITHESPDRDLRN
jgi:hypothetical protein